VHDDAYIGGRSENNIKCVVMHDDLGWKSDFLSFIVVEHIRFFHGAIQLQECQVIPQLGNDDVPYFSHFKLSCWTLQVTW